MQDDHAETRHDDRADEPPVEDLIVELLDRTERDPSSRDEVVDELCRRWPSRERKLRSVVESLVSTGLMDGDELPESVGEFRPIRRLGSGGMGVVLLAEQPSLGRRVAIKLLRSDELLRRGARERFMREIEAVARLAHPNVVSVHSVGHDGGVPFLVMDHVAGVSLDRVLAAQQERRPEDLTGADFLTALRAEMIGHGEVPERIDEALFAGSWADVCVRVTRDVAAALAHAHSRGVLHRDIKPSNVMVTADGRVLLVDFGLAAVQDMQRLTRSNSQLGSLPYMPPESLDGRGEPSERGDIYSLGVTLCEMLLLELPFPGRGSARLRSDVEEGRFTPIRAGNPSVSHDLETVLRCATSREPERRYPTASAFVTDLTNVLHRRPVVARPTSSARRVLEWARRRPERAALAAIGVAAVVGGPLVYGFLQGAHARETTELNRKLGIALSDETEARATADANYQSASDAILRVTAQMARDGLDHEPRMQRARLAIADDAIRIYTDLRDRAPDNVETTYRWADLHLSRGRILSDLGRLEEAVADFDLHVTGLERLVDAHPEQADYAHDLALGRISLGVAHRRAGRSDESARQLALGVDVARTVEQRHPGVVLYATTLVQGLVDAAITQLESGRPGEAEAALDEALALAEELAETREDVASAQHARARAKWMRGRVAAAKGSLESAVEAFRDSTASAESARRLAPGNRVYDELLVEATNCMIEVEARLGRSADALRQLDGIEGLARDLERRYPSIYGYHLRVLELIGLRSLVFAQSGDLPRAVEFAELAMERHIAYTPPPGEERRHLTTTSALGSNLAARLVACTPLGDERFSLAESAARSALEAAIQLDSRAHRREACYPLVLALAGQNRLDDARDEAIRLATASRDLPDEQRYLADAWCEIHLACVRRGADGTDAAELALAALERAVAAGYSNRDELRTTPALDPLRAEPRFAAILRALDPQR